MRMVPLRHANVFLGVFIGRGIGRLKKLNRKFKYGHFKFPETRQDHSSEGD
jgi:hypothetical protein